MFEVPPDYTISEPPSMMRTRTAQDKDDQNQQ
jgi:hypothetical protein